VKDQARYLRTAGTIFGMRFPMKLYSPNIQIIKDRTAGSLILSILRTKRTITCIEVIQRRCKIATSSRKKRTDILCKRISEGTGLIVKLGRKGIQTIADNMIYIMYLFS